MRTPRTCLKDKFWELARQSNRQNMFIKIIILGSEDLTAMALPFPEKLVSCKDNRKAKHMTNSSPIKHPGPEIFITLD